MAAIAHPTPHRRQVHIRPTLRLVRNPPHLSDSVYRRRRLGALALLSAVMLAVAGIVFALSNVANAHGAPVAVDTSASAGAQLDNPGTAGTGRASPVGGSVYVVQPGDTLWSIARELRPTSDPRAEVDRLTELNGTAALQVGQRLRLTPVPGS